MPNNQPAPSTTHGQQPQPARKSSFDFSTYATRCRDASVDGTELSFYTEFENFLLDMLPYPYKIISNPASKKKIGHPDFQGSRNGVPFLRIEAKPPKYDVKKWLSDPSCHPDATRLSEQLHKYDAPGMVILVTDFKMIWWVDTGSMEEDATTKIPILHEFHVLTDSFSVHPSLDEDVKLLANLIYLDLETAKTGIMDLIDHVMPHVKLLRDELSRIQKAPSGKEEKMLQKHMNEVMSDLRKTMFKDCEDDLKKKFIDLYTQLIAYGMFMAWIKFNKAPKRELRQRQFSVETVSSFLPVGSLMRDLFTGVKDNATPKLMDGVFVPMEKWFNRTEYVDIASKMEELMNEFYSGFLEKYDKETRKDMGVVYTPREVVDFMTRGVDHFLRRVFQMKTGILDPAVKYLDPSAGTMAYPCSLMELGHQKICDAVDSDEESFGTDSEKQEKFNKWFKKFYLRGEEGLGNVFGFEILMAPYILGSMRVLMTAEKLGVPIDYAHDEPQMYLMNTLMDYPENKTLDEFLMDLDNPRVKRELRAGLNIRKREEIMVLMTNPPYNVSSQNSSDWITKLVDEYITEENLKREPGKPQIKGITGLKSSKDDYWKFLRFAQWKIAENGKKHGIVAFITNNFYIDGIVARGLRKEYRKSFDEIWIVNLNGDWKKSIPERAGTSVDENIFGVNCGIAIIFAIRYPQKEHLKHKKGNEFACDVKYHESWGTAGSKLRILDTKDIPDLTFETVDDKLDWEFTPHIQTDVNYGVFPYLCDIFLKNICGVGTGHDDMMAYDINGARKINEMLHETYAIKDAKDIDDPGKMWNPKKMVGADIDTLDNAIHEIAWRGFDRRYISYRKELLARDRFEVMQYMLDPDNVAIGVARTSRKNRSGSSVLIQNTIMELHDIEGGSGIGDYIFPLKINNSTENDVFDHPKPAIHSNINPRLMSSLPYWHFDDLDDAEKMVESEKVFYYIYGMLHAPMYREKYKGMLSMDYPRIPFPVTKEIFEEMSSLGRKLASFHLMTDDDTRKFKRQKTNIDSLQGTSYKIGKYGWIQKGANNIGAIAFNAKKKTKKNADGTITVTFDIDESTIVIKDVPKEVWEFEIGGIQQLDQWLGSRRYDPEPKKDHLTRGIDQEELKYFLRVVNAITDTIALYPSLDAAYGKVEKDILPVIIPVPEPKEEKFTKKLEDFNP